MQLHIINQKNNSNTDSPSPLFYLHKKQTDQHCTTLFTGKQTLFMMPPTMKLYTVDVLICQPSQLLFIVFFILFYLLLIAIRQTIPAAQLFIFTGNLHANAEKSFLVYELLKENSNLENIQLNLIVSSGSIVMLIVDNIVQYLQYNVPLSFKSTLLPRISSHNPSAHNFPNSFTSSSHSIIYHTLAGNNENHIYLLLIVILTIFISISLMHT